LAPIDNSSAVSVLDWQRDYESVYPTMIVVACGLLSVPATLVQWERLFFSYRSSCHETEITAPPYSNWVLI